MKDTVLLALHVLLYTKYYYLLTIINFFFKNK